MKQDLALQALNRAIALRKPSPGCIHHTGTTRIAARNIVRMVTRSCCASMVLKYR